MKLVTSLLFVSLILLGQVSSQGTQSQVLQSVCNLYAASTQRFGSQYQGDISSQRCSFCQYSQANSGGQPFASGCSTCPDYKTGWCQTCSSSYAMTQSKFCIPCPEGSTCCAGNNATQDANYVNSIMIGADQGNASYQQVIYQSLIQYTGTRQVTCNEGYFAIGHVCKELPTGCIQMNVSENYYYCQKCSPGYYLDSNNQCSKQCSALYNKVNPQPNSYIDNCGSCVSPSVCASCNTSNGYYYLEPLPSTTEVTTKPIDPTIQTMQVCSQCSANCVDCSKGTDTCVKCSNNYYYDAGAKLCQFCTAPTKFVTLNQGVTVDQYYSGCVDGNKLITSYNFNGSIPQLDRLQQPAPRPIVKLSGGTYTACDSFCTACTPTDSNTTVCTACMNGYYLDQSTQTPTCTICPRNSLICQWNPTIKKPQVLVCNINTGDLNPPYSFSYYLQLEFTAANFGADFSKYVPDDQCVSNNNHCKQMINDITQIGKCASCYDQPSDFASGLTPGNTQQTLYTMTSIKTCRACVAPSATCQESTTNPGILLTKTCLPGYRPTPQGGLGGPCISCPLNCLTCDDTGTCTACNQSTSFTLMANNQISQCKVPYTTSNTLEGCINWGSGTTFPASPNCIQCSPNYILINGVTVTDGTNKATANLCMSCPQNCTACNSQNRSQCTACAPGSYLVNQTCMPIPQGCATFKSSGQCSYCQYGYTLINDSFCTLCDNPNGISFSTGQLFSCPGAQCSSGSSDEPTSSSTSSPIIITFSVMLVLFNLLF